MAESVETLIPAPPDCQRPADFEFPTALRFVAIQREPLH